MLKGAAAAVKKDSWSLKFQQNKGVITNDKFMGRKI